MYKNYFDFKKKKITLVELLTCVISIGAFIVSIFALYDSCTANKRATHNANTINRIECRNMIASETPELLESYFNMIIIATHIYNNPTGFMINSLHTTFQNDAEKVQAIIKKIFSLSTQYGYNGKTERLDMILKLTNIAQKSDLKEFEKFSDKSQDKHNENLNWLKNHDLGDDYCSESDLNIS